MELVNCIVCGKKTKPPAICSSECLRQAVAAKEIEEEKGVAAAVAGAKILGSAINHPLGQLVGAFIGYFAGQRLLGVRDGRGKK